MGLSSFNPQKMRLNDKKNIQEAESRTMKKIMIFVSLLMLLFSSSVFAHVTNEKTIYDDIEFSEAKEEIVYLRGQ